MVSTGGKEASELARDIAAARADLRGRRDQLAAEFEERLQSLEKLENELQAGSVEPRVAQGRLRQLTSDPRAAGSAKPTRAGRTRIGMQAPATPHPATIPTPNRGGGAGRAPTAAKASAALNKAQTDIDVRIVSVMAAPAREAAQYGAKLEVGLLWQLRNALAQQTSSLPEDVVLLEGVLELTEHVDSVLTDLAQGGSARAGRLLEFAQQLLSQLRALGADTGNLKDRIRKARNLLAHENADVDAIMSEAWSLFGALRQALQKQWPVEQPTLVDELLKPEK